MKSFFSLTRVTWNTLIVQVKNNLIREMIYRTNFMTTVMTDAIWLCVEFGLFKVIYANTSTLGGWTQEQAFFFLGVFFTSDSIFSTFFQRNFWQFPGVVNTGELDIFLIKPVPALILCLTRWMNLSTIFNFSLGILIMLRYGDAAGFQGGFYWVIAALWILFGVVISFLLRFVFTVVVFWTERSWAFTSIYYYMINFASKPDLLFPKTIRMILKTALPFALIGSIPARALLGQLSSQEFAMTVVVLLFFTALSMFLWRRGLLRYQSASS